MLRRYLPHLFVVTAVALCAAFVVHLLRSESPDESIEPVVSAGLTPKPLVTLAPEPKRETKPAVPVREAPPRSTPTTDTPPDTEPSPGIEKAIEALEHLKQLLRNSLSTNADILAALAQVQEYYLRPPAPRGLVLHVPPRNGPSAEGRIVSEANLKQFADEQGWPDAYRKQVEKFRKGAEKQFLKALELQRVDRETKVNAREPVNIEAAKVLGGAVSPKMSKRVISVLETSLLRARYEVSTDLYDAAFGALGRLGHPDGLAWLQEEFTHTKASPPRVVAQAVAAREAMLLFDPKTIRGVRRYRMVAELVKTYSSAEAVAAQDSHDRDVVAIKAYWKRVGPGVIQVVQRFAGRPRDVAGRQIDTMAGFMAWLREHKDPRKPPWTDD